MAQIKTKEEQYMEMVSDFVSGELDDYSAFDWRIDHESQTMENGKLYVDIYVHMNWGRNAVSTVSFKVDDDGLFVELGEGNYEQAVLYDHTVKYFWMALL